MSKSKKPKPSDDKVIINKSLAEKIVKLLEDIKMLNLSKISPEITAYKGLSKAEVMKKVDDLIDQYVIVTTSTYSPVILGKLVSKDFTTDETMVELKDVVELNTNYALKLKWGSGVICSEEYGKVQGVIMCEFSNGILDDEATQDRLLELDLWRIRDKRDKITLYSIETITLVPANIYKLLLEKAKPYCQEEFEKMRDKQYQADIKPQVAESTSKEESLFTWIKAKLAEIKARLTQTKGKDVN